MDGYNRKRFKPIVRYCTVLQLFFLFYYTLDYFQSQYVPSYFVKPEARVSDLGVYCVCLNSEYSFLNPALYWAIQFVFQHCFQSQISNFVHIISSLSSINKLKTSSNDMIVR